MKNQLGKNENSDFKENSENRIQGIAADNKQTSSKKISQIDRKKAILGKINSWFDWWAWLG